MFQLPVSVILLLILNRVSLVFYGVDKLKSISARWRIPESQLLFVALVAPFGALTGMLLFRHKIRKIKFFLVPIFMFIQLYLIFKFQIIPISW